MGVLPAVLVPAALGREEGVEEVLVSEDGEGDGFEFGEGVGSVDGGDVDV